MSAADNTQKTFKDANEILRNTIFLEEKAPTIIFFLLLKAPSSTFTFNNEKTLIFSMLKLMHLLRNLCSAKCRWHLYTFSHTCI